MKTYLITGTSKGIGLSIARKLLHSECRVIGISRSPFPDTHPHYTHYAIDLSCLKTLPSNLKEIADNHPQINGLICNAGMGHFGNLEELSFHRIESLIDLNFLSQVFIVKTFLPLLKKQQQGDIIFLGSEAALSGKKKGSIYCASKFALRGFTQALREECSSDHIRVTLINPGMVKTGFFDELHFHPGQEPCEFIEPQDIADTISWVLSTRPGTVFDEINISPQKKKIIFPLKNRGST